MDALSLIAAVMKNPVVMPAFVGVLAWRVWMLERKLSNGLFSKVAEIHEAVVKIEERCEEREKRIVLLEDGLHK